MPMRRVTVPPSNRESGQILVLTAVSMVALLGIAALSLDASLMYDKRNRLHAAADAAAKSAAIEVVRNSGISLAALQRFADQQVQANGFTPSRLGGTTSVVINHGPTSGPFAGNVNYVEAIVSEPTSTFFATVLGFASMTPGATAVAGISNPTNCLITTGGTGTVPTSLDIGNTTITLNGCGAAVGGDLSGSNHNATINGTPTPSVAVTGTCFGTCGAMGSMTTGAPTPNDPLAGLVAPSNPGGCKPGVAAVLTAGCYTSIASTVKTLTAGIYYVTGTVDVDSLSGSGVMIYLTGGGNIQGGNGGSLTLTAPTSGAYTGIAIFQDPTNVNSFDAKNGFNLNVSGAIYMPNVDVAFKNSLSITQTNCTIFVAKSLYIKNGNGSVSNSGCAATYASAPFLTVTIAQ